MSRNDFIEYPSAMQLAFANAAVTSASKAGRITPAAKRVARVADRVKLRRELAINTKLSFRTAQRLKADGVIE